MGKILITGASGFIGSNFIRFIKKNHTASVNNLLLLTSKPVEGFDCIIRNQNNLGSELKNKIKDEPIDVVFHFGAFTPKESSQANLIAECNSNISSTYELINALPSVPKKIIFSSTLDIYNFNEIISEKSIPQPQSLYGLSKLYCEKMLEQYAAKNKNILQIVRIGHVYGEGEENYKKIIPVTIKNCLAGINPTLFTDGNEMRAFIHIEDVCRLIFNSKQSEVSEGPVNIVSSKSQSISEIVKTIISLINPELTIEFKKQSKGISTLFDNSRMIQKLGTESISMTDGLKQEINYFKNLQS